MYNVYGRKKYLFQTIIFNFNVYIKISIVRIHPLENIKYKTIYIFAIWCHYQENRFTARVASYEIHHAQKETYKQSNKSKVKYIHYCTFLSSSSSIHIPSSMNTIKWKHCDDGYLFRLIFVCTNVLFSSSLRTLCPIRVQPRRHWKNHFGKFIWVWNYSIHFIEIFEKMYFKFKKYYEYKQIF